DFHHDGGIPAGGERTRRSRGTARHGGQPDRPGPPERTHSTHGTHDGEPGADHRPGPGQPGLTVPAALKDRPRPWLASPAPAGVFLDFDGPLAPIVEVPEDARPLPGAAALLGQLAERYRRVAVVSGRPLAFLLDHLGASAGHAELVGLYGLERAA